MLHGWEKLTAEEKETIALGVADGNVYGGPYHAELSLTDNCNYDCFFCNQAFVDRSKSIPIERLKALIDELAGMGLKVLRLSGGGEPLLHPKIRDFLDDLPRHGITMDNVTTNGFMLTPPIVERLIALPTREMIVSLNESHPQRYAEMMKVRQDWFHRVVENMKAIIAERNRRGVSEPRMVAQFFVWKGNYRHLDEMITLSKEIGVDSIYLRTIYGLEESQRLTEEERDELRRLTEPHIQRESRDDLAIDYTFENIVFDSNPKGERKPPCSTGRDRYCYIGWYSTTIRGNGDVYPCCILQQLPDYPVLGNVLHHSFREIWLGDAYRQLRRELRMMALQRGELRDPGKLIQTKPFCAAENECPLLLALCDDAFYTSMNNRLESQRRSIRQKLAQVMLRTL